MQEISKRDVELFLQRFYQKVQIFGMVFRNDRNKNQQALFELDITAKYRENVVMQLSVEDYVEGPVEDTLNKGSDLWVFGKDVKGREVYIKISMGRENYPTICISFHIAENRLKYLFKEE